MGWRVIAQASPVIAVPNKDYGKPVITSDAALSAPLLAAIEALAGARAGDQYP